MVENKKPRTLVNLIGAPLLLSIIYLGGPLFTLFIFVVIFISTYEFDNMIKIKSFSLNLYFFFFIYLIFLINHLFQIFSYEQYRKVISYGNLDVDFGSEYNSDLASAKIKISSSISFLFFVISHSTCGGIVIN